MADTDHPNVSRIQKALEAYAASDWSAMKPFLDDDIVWHVGGNHPLSGTYKGQEAVLGYFAKAQELTGGSLKLSVDEILANDSYGAVWLTATGAREGRTLDVQLAEAFRLGSDGKWVEYWALADDQPAVDDFWR